MPNDMHASRVAKKFADLSAIKVLRGVGKNQTIVNVNYNNLIRGQGLDSNVLLKAGDTILVP